MPPAAVEEEGAVPVREPGIPLGVVEVGPDFQESAGLEPGAGDVARRELVRLADVEEVPALVAGNVEEAMDCLERAASGGLLQKGWYEHDGDLDPLRGHPRFKALLERM